MEGLLDIFTHMMWLLIWQGLNAWRDLVSVMEQIQVIAAEKNFPNGVKHGGKGNRRTDVNTEIFLILPAMNLDQINVQ